MAKKTKNEIAEVEDKNLVVMEFDAEDFDSPSDDTRDDFAVPKLILLQSKSPQVEEDGMGLASMYNNVTEEELPMGTEVVFVPVTKERVFDEREGEEGTGKYLGTHLPNSDVVKAAKASSTKFGRYHTEKGNRLIEKVVMYCINAQGLPFVIDVKGVSFKHYKRLRTNLGQIMVQLPDGSKRAAPLHSNLCVLTTDKEKTDNGIFAAFNFKRSETIGKDNPLFQSAKQFKALLAEGTVQVATTDRDETTSEEGEEAF